MLIQLIERHPDSLSAIVISWRQKGYLCLGLSHFRKEHKHRPVYLHQCISPFIVKHITEDFRIPGQEKSECEVGCPERRGPIVSCHAFTCYSMAPSRNHSDTQAIGLPTIYSSIMKHRRPSTILCTSDTNIMVMFRRRG